MTINVTKRDGSTAPYDGYEIARSIAEAADGLGDQIERATQLRAELEITLFDGITSEQLDEAVVHVALGNVKDDPAFDTIAARLLIKSLYKKIFGEGVTRDEVQTLCGPAFVASIKRGVTLGLLDDRLDELFDLDLLGSALDPDRDDLLRYTGAQTMRNRYMISEPDGTPLEIPQFFWMRVAMGLSLNEEDPNRAALAFYDKMSRLEYLAAGSTLVNAGTRYSQLSNCFVLQMEDDIEHIAKTVRDVMWLTKGTGGIGLSVSKLRAEGSPIRSNNTRSTGPIPFMHTVDSTLRAISRGGKKFGALAFYMENWHLDFGQFLDLKQNSGDPYRRTRTANTAVWISDEFMRRVHADEPWLLFDPLDTPDLVELTGSAFSARYAEYVEQAEAGTLRHKRTTAREQFRQILVTLQTTSHPWLTWKDTINTRALNDNTGTIHSSNLCTEITLPQDRENVSVCNLASINLSRHVTGRHSTVGEGEAKVDWNKLAESARLAVRQLDNLIDITISSVPESEKANEENRALGLGVMGFTDVVERFGWAYDSPQAYDLIDQLVEFISWHAIDASADLARDRGSYQHFDGSGWSRGLVPVDTLDRLATDRDRTVEVDRTARMDWNALRAKVAGGMRNSTLMAIAPTASIGLVAGTTPGLDPQFSQIFSRATSSGKFLEVNRNLVADLQERGLWESLREDLLRHQGDLSKVEGAPADLVEIYKTSFQLDPKAFITVAARAQKWIDQAISRNMYLASRDIDDMVDVYSAAWRMGVKSTYYLHMMPRHTAEQSTVKVNKAEQLAPAGGAGAPKRGFGAAKKGFGAATATPAPAAVVADEPVVPDTVEELDVVDGAACPIDPQERLNCESCQ